jgi:hypothetical protein
VTNNLIIPGKFDFIFETNLGYESEDQVGAFYEKNRSEKSRASVPLRAVLSSYQSKYGNFILFFDALRFCLYSYMCTYINPRSGRMFQKQSVAPTLIQHHYS